MFSFITTLLSKMIINPKNTLITILFISILTLSSYNYFLSKRVDTLKLKVDKTNTLITNYKKEVKTLNNNIIAITSISTKIKKETAKKEIFTKKVLALPKITETYNGDTNEKYISAYNELIDPWVQSSNSNSTSTTGPPDSSTTT